MTDQKRIILESLSMDLLRVALGRHRGQEKMAKRFTEEAKSRLGELADFTLSDKVLLSLNSTAKRSAEDLLMYSTLVRNHALISTQ